MFGLYGRRIATRALRGIALLAIIAGVCFSQQGTEDEPNTEMMRSTFLISGPERGHPGRTSFGTAFIVGTPSKADAKKLFFTLVTAAHVLDDIDGDVGTLLLRKRRDDGTYEPFSFAVQIRNHGQPSFAKHPNADVAAMYVGLPDLKLQIVPKAFLADDARVRELELHPGDEAFCLGFPLGASATGAFPILRTGRIASYPLLPSSIVRQWMFDLFLYPGNSGGPVFINSRMRDMDGSVAVGGFFAILGLVIQQSSSAIPEFADKPLNLGIIVPAHFILETLDRLSSEP
jgi:S1-C subfamily serine protease